MKNTKRKTLKTRKTRKTGGEKIKKKFEDKVELKRVIIKYCSEKDKISRYTKNYNKPTEAQKYVSNVIKTYGEPKNWDVSNITDMSHLFFDNRNFNEDISGWDVSNVTNMSNMFNRASSFNQSLEEWDVSNVTDMSNMFNGASSFNQSLKKWNVSNVTNMSNMFKYAIAFENDSYKGIASKLFSIPNQISDDMLESMFTNVSTGDNVKKKQEEPFLNELARASHVKPTLRKLQHEIVSYLVSDKHASDFTRAVEKNRKEIQDKYHSKL